MSEEKGRDEKQWCLHGELIVQCHTCLSNMLIAEKVEVSALKAKLAQYERPFDDAEVQEAWATVRSWQDVNWIPLRFECSDHLSALRVLAAAIRRERANNESYKATFDLQHTRTVKADKLWQVAHDKPDVWPDLGELIDWLLGRADAAERELAQWKESDQRNNAEAGVWHGRHDAAQVELAEAMEKLADLDSVYKEQMIWASRQSLLIDEHGTIPELVSELAEAREKMVKADTIVERALFLREAIFNPLSGAVMQEAACNGLWDALAALPAPAAEGEKPSSHQHCSCHTQDGQECCGCRDEKPEKELRGEKPGHGDGEGG